MEILMMDYLKPDSTLQFYLEIWNDVISAGSISSQNLESKWKCSSSQDFSAPCVLLVKILCI